MGSFNYPMFVLYFLLRVYYEGVCQEFEKVKIRSIVFFCFILTTFHLLSPLEFDKRLNIKYSYLVCVRIVSLIFGCQRRCIWSGNHPSSLYHGKQWWHSKLYSGILYQCTVLHCLYFVVELDLFPLRNDRKLILILFESKREYRHRNNLENLQQRFWPSLFMPVRRAEGKSQLSLQVHMSRIKTTYHYCCI